MSEKYDLYIDQNFLFEIVEKETGFVVDRMFFEDDANERLHFLNSGGAFDGWTPEFMLNSIPKSNLNEAFSQLALEIE